MTAQEKALHIDIPVKLTEVKNVQRRVAVVRRRSAGVSLSPSAHCQRCRDLERQVPGCSGI